MGQVVVFLCTVKDVMVTVYNTTKEVGIVNVSVLDNFIADK